MNDVGGEKQLRRLFIRSTFPSGVTFQITDKVSLSLSGFKLHSSSHSSRGNIGITCTRGQGKASQARVRHENQHSAQISANKRFRASLIN